MYLDNRQFPFTAALEANWEAIRDELLNLSRGSFMPFFNKGSLYEGTWEVFGLYTFGRRNEANCARCPETARVVETIPRMVTAGFSWLEPGTHIKPHVGYTPAVLRCHLGLITPEGCALRVGPEVRGWHEGECMVFDDTTEHEAWNRSDSVRAVLIIDFEKDDVSCDPTMQKLKERRAASAPALKTP
ncbi:MAG TPA: aspartyl/asparaginyl beta-hydroxylase domain-containing protein [Isosphaeraceae bacterium]